MKKETILKTAVCRYDSKDGIYVVESPLFANVIGAAESERKAWTIYRELLADMWEAHLEGRLATCAKPGRPSKGIINVNVQVTPEIRDLLKKNAHALGVSQGDFVAFAVKAAEAHLSSLAIKPYQKATGNKLNVVAEKQSAKYRASSSKGKPSRKH